jgi:hypothetical protein
MFEECTVDLIGSWKVQVCGKPRKFEAFDVPDQDLKSRSQVKNPSPDPKPRFQTKNISHNCCLFVCLFVFFFFSNSRMENDSQKCHIRDVCTTAKNPQDMASTKEYIDEALLIATHTMKAAIHSTPDNWPQKSHI